MSESKELTDQDHLDAIVVNLLNTDPDLTILVIAVSLMFSIPVRIVIKQFNFKISQNAILVVMAVIVTCALTFLDAAEPIQHILLVPPHRIFAVFIPIHITSVIYHLDCYVFARTLPQLMMILFMGIILGPLILGAIFAFVLHNNWTFLQGVIAALVTVPNQPLHVVVLFKKMSKYRYLATILDGESIFLIVATVILFEVCIGMHDNIITSWTQCLLVILRYLTGGFLVGAIVGAVQKHLMIWLYNNPSYALCVSIGLTYFTYYFCEYIMVVSGALGVLVMNCMIVFEKHRFTTEVDQCLTIFWSTMHYFVEMATLMISVGALSLHLMKYFDVKNLYGTFIIYLAITANRLLTFLLMMPILKWMRYEMNIKCLLVLGWGNIKGCINLNLLLLLFQNPRTVYLAKTFLIEMVMYTFLSIWINSMSMNLLLNMLGLTEMSSARKSKMDHCLKILMEKRFAIINILKMNRYLALSNWRKAKKDTYLQQSFQYFLKDKTIEKPDDEYFWRREKTVCPACVLEMPYDVTEKELGDLVRQTQDNLLKSKKIAVIRQFENGVINKNCLHVLVHNFEIMIESSKQIKNPLESKNFLVSSKFLLFLRRICQQFVPSQIYTPPPTQLRRLCFYLIMHFIYDPIIYFVILINAILSNLAPNTSTIRTLIYSIFFFNTFFFLTDFLIKMNSYSISIPFFSGIKPYFRSKRNIFDYCMLLLSILNLFFVTPMTVDNWIFHYFLPASRTLAIIRLLSIISVFSTFCPYFIKLLNTKIDAKLCFQFDLATSLLLCLDEILENLTELVEVAMIRDVCRRELIEERDNLSKKMQILQNEKPLISITVKTKQAISTSLQAMENTLKECKTAGLVDQIEYMFIFKKIFDQQKKLRNMTFVQPSSPKSIFKEILWIKDSLVGDTLMDYLYQNAHIVLFDVDEVICRSNQCSKGIYIVVSGLVHLKYKPRYVQDGCLLIIDYLNTLDIKSPINDIILPGNTIGELCFLTGRPYDCTLYAGVATKAYYISSDIMRKALKLNMNPINGLEARMWKCSVINIAIAIMISAPYYQNYTVQKIRLKLEKSFVPNLKCYKIFVVTEMMDDIILIEGVAADYSSGEIFTAPKLIPRAVQKLVFPKSSLLNVATKLETKLLIIPMGEANDIDIMTQEEDRADLVAKVSSKCLLHPIDEQKKMLSTYRSSFRNKDSAGLYSGITNVEKKSEEDKEVEHFDSQEDQNSHSDDYLKSYSDLKVQLSGHDDFLIRRSYLERSGTISAVDLEEEEEGEMD